MVSVPPASGRAAGPASGDHRHRERDRQDGTDRKRQPASYASIYLLLFRPARLAPCRTLLADAAPSGLARGRGIHDSGRRLEGVHDPVALADERRGANRYPSDDGSRPDSSRARWSPGQRRDGHRQVVVEPVAGRVEERDQDPGHARPARGWRPPRGAASPCPPAASSTAPVNRAARSARCRAASEGRRESHRAGGAELLHRRRRSRARTARSRAAAPARRRAAAPRPRRPACRARGRRRRSCRSCPPRVCHHHGKPAVPKSRSIQRERSVSCFGIPESDMNADGIPMPQKDWSPARGKRRARGCLAGHVVHDLLAKLCASSVAWTHRVVGGAAGPGRVDVQVHRAAPVELAPRVVRVPGRARVAPVGVPRPERQAEAAPERAPPARQEPRDLEHRRVRRAVVHRAEVPAVHVPREQDEAVLGGAVEVRRSGAGSASSPCAPA